MPFKTNDGIVVHPRREWGARPVADTAYAHQVRPFAAVVHHGGEDNPPLTQDAEVAALMRRWQAFHMDARRWSDIAYAYIMDGRGELWAGRPVWAIGAHVFLQNTGRIGICLPQDGTRFGFTPEQEKTFRKLFRVRHDKLGLPALKKFARDPSPLAGVFGHLQVPGQSTVCPGPAIMADLRNLTMEFA